MVKFLGIVLVNAIVSGAVSLAVYYHPPGLPTPQQMVWAVNGNTRAITKLSNSTLEVIKKLNEIAPPPKAKEIKK